MQDAFVNELQLGEEAAIERGVIVQRRCFMVAAATAFAAANLGESAYARKLDPRRDRLSYEDFLARVIPLAKQLVGDTSVNGQAAYLHTIAAHAVWLESLQPPEMRANGAGTSIGAHEGGDPFTVLHWRMEPGSIIGTHPHIYGNVVTLCLEGDVHVSNYEVIGDRDWDAVKPFRVRRTVTQWLSPGHVNLVNLERNYMHGFRAGSRVARGLDITTRIREKRPSPTLVLDPKSPGTDDVWDASWKS